MIQLILNCQYAIKYTDIIGVSMSEPHIDEINM